MFTRFNKDFMYYNNEMFSVFPDPRYPPPFSDEEAEIAELDLD